MARKEDAIFSLIVVGLFVISAFAVGLTAAPVVRNSTATAPAIFHPFTVTGQVNEASLNWAGYAVTGPNHSVTSVTASFIVPNITGSKSNTYVAVWAGIDGFSDGTVEQAGILAESLHGSTVYLAWTEFYPAAPTYASWSPSPGNVMTVTVSSGGYGKSITATVVDRTSTHTYSNTVTSTSSYMLSSAEWIVERPAIARSLTSLANFGTAYFGCKYTGGQPDTATLSGTTGSIGSFVVKSSTATVVSLAMVTYSAIGGKIKLLASPSSLTGSEDGSFSVAYIPAHGH